MNERSRRAASRRRPDFTRRELLRAGAALGVGWTLRPFTGAWAMPRTAPRPAEPPARAFIHIFLGGGLSHLDSFDPKPFAPVDVRGDWKPIATKLTGEVFAEPLARTARIADKIAVIRSVTHGDAAHERGTQTMLTGHPASQALAYPSFGAVIAHELAPQNAVPPYVCIPQADDVAFGTGYLGGACGPFSLGAEPRSATFKVRDLDLGDAVGAERVLRRRRLLGTIDAGFAGAHAPDGVAAMNAFYERAWRLIDAPAAREAFQINKEPQKSRQRYGMTNLGQRLLLARRLAAAGARCVTVVDRGYDNHLNLYSELGKRLADFDQGFAALVEDLDASGLLASTVVLVSTEFGRTPRLNQTGGRDHWSRVFSCVVAGGGLRSGLVVGASDASGAEPAERPVKPADLAATVFRQLGIDPAKKLASAGGRPIELVREGEPIAELLA
jgi:uncharacterized protein (DUF1501 family)